MSEKFTVAYVGLGIMGRPAAAHLLKAGHNVRVYARREAATKLLADLGATVCKSPAEAAQGAHFAITNVSDTPDVEQVILGDSGFIEGLEAGAVVLDMSTIAPTMARTVAAKLAEKDIGFIDAPVSGGQAGAKAGILAFMCGGEKEHFEKILPLMEVMGSSYVLVGSSGAGQVAKCVNQILIGATVNAVAEAFAMTRAMDVDPARVRDAILGGFAGSKVLEVHAKRMIDDEFTPGFTAKLNLKDINIALDTAKQCGVEVPSAEVFRDRLVKVIDAGMGDLDSAVASKALDL